MNRSVLQFQRSTAGGGFDQVLGPHLDRLFRLAFRFTGSRADAEDLVQDLCLRMLPRLGQLKRLDRPGPWLARALYNLFVDQHRRENRSPVDRVDELPEVESDDPGPLQRAVAAATVDRIEAALARLPPEQRAVVAWHDIEGYTLEELSAGEGVPLGTLKSRLHRARCALRQVLVEPFGAG